MSSYITPELSNEQTISIIKNGLNQTNHPKNIIIVGAGMAGLVSASLLKQAGHNVTILEASERVGGRVFTKRSEFRDGQYFEAGAMRIPHTHLYTLEYIKKFKLSTNSFINSTPNDIINLRGIKIRLNQYVENPTMLDFMLAPNEKGKSAIQLLQYALEPVINFFNENPQKNWPVIVEKFDKYSMEFYLKENPFGRCLSPGAVEILKVMLSSEGFPELSFLELLHDVANFFKPGIQFYEITGGFDQLPKAFVPELKENIHYGHKVMKIVQHDNQVTIHTEHKKSGTFQTRGDLAIITIPFSVLQFVEIEPVNSFSGEKWKAIRQLHYVNSTKIGIQFSNRFWEEEGMYGGKTSSDLPITYTQYPSNNLYSKGPGVVLASYTWEDDAVPWDSLADEDRIHNALKNLSTIHGNHVYHAFQAGATHSWLRDPNYGGAFAMFKPYQAMELSPYISKPEGRVYFAGEHASSHHGWIQGAIESAIYAAFEVNNLPRTCF